MRSSPEGKSALLFQTLAIDPVSGARILSAEPIAYSDGAEEYVAGVVADAVDRTANSFELEMAVTDWSTSCHFSPTRSNLLDPLALAPGARVLDLGGGTGVLARALIDRGALVTLVDSSLKRARIAAERCAGTNALDLIVGRIEDTDAAYLGTFDLVLGVGVFEYQANSGAESLAARLQHASSFLNTEGAICIAIENQLGLKYLAGYLEDHLSLPWVGVEGYPSGGIAETPTRQKLANILESIGLINQRWYFPFPDYKHPSVIISDELYRHPEGAEIIDSLVRKPCHGSAPQPLLLFDERAAHRSFLNAGLGPDVANSFLVFASQDEVGHLQDSGTLAWISSMDRSPTWRRKRTIRLSGSRLEVADPDARAQQTKEWLTQTRTATEPFISGSALDVKVAESLGRRDLGRVEDLLTQWRLLLENHAKTEQVETPEHPFLFPGRRAVLPADFLDVDLGNFVLAERLSRIDREWSAGPGVDLLMVAFRALLNFSEQILMNGSNHPFGADADQWSLARSLASLAGLPVADASYVRIPAAADELSAIVGNGQRYSVTDPRTSLARLPFSALRRRLVELTDEIAAHHGELDSLRAEVSHRTAAQRRLSLLSTDLQHRLALTEEELVIARSAVDEFAVSSRGLQSHLEEIDSLLKRESEGTRALSDEIRVIRGSERWLAGGLIIGPLAALRRAVGRLRTRGDAITITGESDDR